MNKEQENFVRQNKGILREIYKDRINGIMDEVLEMESNEERVIKLDTLRALKEEYKMFGFIGERKSSEPERFT